MAPKSENVQLDPLMVTFADIQPATVAKKEDNYGFDN